MGTNTMVAAVGLVIGPVLGGALVSISWHWVFWFNVPLALVGGLWGAFVLRELARRDTVRGFDLAGTLTFVVGLTGLVYGISRGGISGWHDPLVIGVSSSPPSSSRSSSGSSTAAAHRCSTSRFSATASSPPPPAPPSSTASPALP